MRFRHLFYLSTVVFFTCCVQGLLAQDADLHDRLKQIVATSSLEKEGMAPWHIRITFQLYDLEGKKKETGMIDEWWSSPTQRKIVIDSPSYHQGDAYGDSVVKDRREGYLVRQLLAQVVNPVPRYERSDKIALLEATKKFGNATLSCLVLQSVSPVVHTLPAASPHLCTEPGKPALRIYTESNNAMFALRNKIAMFRGVEVGLDNTITYDEKAAITGHIDALEAYQPDPPAPAAAVPAQPAPARIAGGVLAGSIIHKQQPTYPDDMKSRHISGTVVLGAIITKTGTISSLIVIASPNPSLSDAAMDAVRHWTYHPYLLNGEPTEVDTTITVNFNLNG